MAADDEWYTNGGLGWTALQYGFNYYITLMTALANALSSSRSRHGRKQVGQ